MNDLLGVLLALTAVILPLALAWYIFARRLGSRGKSSRGRRSESS